MQLLRYEDENGASLGVLRGNRVVSLARAMRRQVNRSRGGGAFASLAGLLARDSKVLLGLGPVALEMIGEALAFDDEDLVVSSEGVEGVKVLPFVPGPEKVFGLGYNYRALCAREGVEPSRYPQVFAKLPTSVIGPFEPVDVPPAIDKVDFEAELCVVIGRTARRVPRERALSHVGAYTVMNDVTAKILPRPGTEAQTTTVALKGADGFGPTGAVVVTPEEIGDPQALQILCRVNGEERQRYPTSDMVHDVADTIAYLSSIITLHPGDLISMGTSLGIGIIEIPPRLLQDGDVVECQIEGFPGCRNEFRIPAQGRPGSVPADTLAGGR